MPLFVKSALTMTISISVAAARFLKLNFVCRADSLILLLGAWTINNILLNANNAQMDWS